MDLPFALVGSHPSCQIRIDKLSVPDLVYVVFSFKETIEVWPTTAIAFPQWGPLAADETLMVGGTQLRFVQQEHESPHAKSYHRSDKMHILDVDRPRMRRRSVVLDHRVQIVGGGHPSTIRIRDVGLSNCEQAIVGFDECCWQLNLRQNIVESDRVKQIFVNDDGMKIGKLNTRYRIKDEQSRKGRLGPGKLASPKPVRMKTLGRVSEVDSLDSEEEPSFGNESDGITEAVTDRLVMLSRNRTLRAKAVRWGLSFLIVAAAGAVLTWIAYDLAPLIDGLWKS